MTREIKVLGSEVFDENGVFLYCTSDEIQELNKNEVMLWFGNVKQVVLDKSLVYFIQSINPMNSFTDKKAVMLKIDTVSVPQISFPTTALVQ